MEEELKKYIEDTAHQLNGQIRGPIGLSARNINLELIQFTLVKVAEVSYNLGVQVKDHEESIEKLKKELKDE